ncbi:MAG: class I SAM-dependent methyltransferase [Armatimonadota bacterium]
MMTRAERGTSGVTTAAAQDCPACGAPSGPRFYDVRQVPVHTVLLMTSRAEALACPRGDVTLVFCETCGMIYNAAFDPGTQAFSSTYEETQGFSETFSTFARRQAADLVERYDLHDKKIIEVGCGKGEFLTLLCDLGGNRGTGFDPSYIEERGNPAAGRGITFIRDFYSEAYADLRADFVCCRMTLEHIHRPSDLLGTIRRAIGERPDVVVFFQVPNVTRILRELAFWDIYYEHCSYFSRGSLTRVFRAFDFDPIRVGKEYGDQYLVLEARPGPGRQSPRLDGEDDPAELARDVRLFADRSAGRMQAWRRRIEESVRDRGKVVIWGSGSKGAAFLTTLGLEDEVEYVVDINPYRQATYMPGTGQRIVPPEFLREYKPDLVIVMNPIYREEIRQQLDHMGLTPSLATV